MAIQSANATVLRVRRIAPLSISQLYFASIVISLRNGLPPRQAQLPRLSGTPEGAPGVPCGVTGSCSAAIYGRTPERFRYDLVNTGQWQEFSGKRRLWRCKELGGYGPLAPLLALRRDLSQLPILLQ